MSQKLLLKNHIQLVSDPQKHGKLILHDTDLHGLTCGINAYYALLHRLEGTTLDIYSHFDPDRAKPATSPQQLPLLLESLGKIDLIVLDIPIDSRNPKRFVEAIANHAQFKGFVLYLDHHGHSEWVEKLNMLPNVTAIIYGTSYELSMSVPRMYNVVDKFVEKWSLIGALSDFDVSIADKVDRYTELLVCEFLDQAWKFKRVELATKLGFGEEYLQLVSKHGNCGAFAKLIVERGVEPDQILEVAKELVEPLKLPVYKVVGDVVYTTEFAQRGTAWKLAWKLCMVSNCKIAIVPVKDVQKDPNTGSTVEHYYLIIAKYWRSDPKVAEVIESYIAKRFSGYLVVGHPGAKSIELRSKIELEEIPKIANELNELVQSNIYTPKITSLLNEKNVAEALKKDLTIFRDNIVQLLDIVYRLSEKVQKIEELEKKVEEILNKLKEKKKKKKLCT